MMALGNVQQCNVSWKLKQPVLTVRLESCTLTKQGERFLTKLKTSSASSDNLIRRFVQSSTKTVVVTTLSHLISPSTSHPQLSPLAHPLYSRMTQAPNGPPSQLYSRMTQAPWFSWNPTTVAELAALLHKLGHRAQSQTLISDAISKLEGRTRELVLFYGKLMDSHSKRNSLSGFHDAYYYLNNLLSTCSSLHVKRRAYEYMVTGLCAMDKPREAEDLVLGPDHGLRPSGFEFKSIVYGYGRLGLFKDMLRVVGEMEKNGFVVDTVCYNMVLSAYGVHREYVEMASWLRRMRNSGVPFSIRTYNSVTNCCSSIVEMTGSLNDLALSIQELNGRLEGGEAMVVRELLGCCVIFEEVMVWDTLEVKLDLHGFHLGSAYLIVLLWLEEMQRRMDDVNYGVPAQVTVVCGSGKHSSVRGESPVRVLVQKMLVNMASPLKVDRKNNGCFIAKGKAVNNWLCQLRKPALTQHSCTPSFAAQG